MADVKIEEQESRTTFRFQNQKSWSWAVDVLQGHGFLWGDWHVLVEDADLATSVTLAIMNAGLKLTIPEQEIEELDELEEIEDLLDFEYED